MQDVLYQQEYFKMIIVDDEPLIRLGLKKYLDWDKYNIAIVGEAGSGIDALQLALEKRPDIIITDIRMPDMDGLELISKLAGELRDSIFIILSGYDYFDYAKKALSMGVFYYLLKPLEFEETTRVFEKCVEKLQENRRKRLLEKSINIKLNENERFLKDRFILSMAQNAMDSEACKKELERLGIDLLNEYYVALLIQDNTQKSVTNAQKSDANIQKSDDEGRFWTIDNTVQQMLGRVAQAYTGKGIKCYSFLSRGGIGCVLSFSSGIDAAGTVKSLIHDFLTVFEKEVSSGCETGTKPDLIFTVGDKVAEIGKLSESFRKAQWLLNYRLLKPSQKVFCYKDFSEENKKPLMLSPEQSRVLINCIENTDTTGLEEFMSALKKDILSHENLSAGQLYSVVHDTIVTSVHFAYKNDMAVENVFIPKIFSSELLSGFQDLDSLFEWLNDFIKHLSLNYMECRFKQPRRIFSEIEKYIMENIDKDVTLNVLAEKFYYNPTYLSRLFSEELGENFSSYIIRIKIEHAKKLLQTTNIKINDVCEAVGYKSYRHFVNTFKKITGVTPIEYKKYRMEKF